MQLEMIILVIVTFLIAGGVKGVIGFGLPTVSITIIAVVVGLTEAMALMVLPSLVTNFWQGVTGGMLRYLLRRFWLVLLLGAISTWMTSSLLVAGEILLFKILLGIVICLYSISSCSQSHCLRRAEEKFGCHLLLARRPGQSPE